MGRGPVGNEGAIELRNIGVRFGALWAVRDVSFGIPEGQRRAIIGPNGAGKTTLVHAINGVLRPTQGSVHLLGRDVTRLSQHGRARMGLGRTYQVPNIFEHLTVLENAYLAAQALRKTKWTPLRRASRYTSVADRAEEVLQDLGLGNRADEVASTLSHGEQRQLEVALALTGRPRLLLLDEPLAGLSVAERHVMRQTVDNIPDDVTVILIEHNMEIVMEVADVVTVLDYGEMVAEGTPDEIRADAEVRRIYLGPEAAEGR